MLNFSFSNSTKIHFGEEQIAKLSSEIPSTAKVLITYGGGSIKKNGVYEQITHALIDHNYVEFSGIEPNPTYETCIQAVDLIKQHDVDYILAVGGGSVIDGSKFIAAAAKFEGEPWDILSKKAKISAALPLGVILTLPATGSESNSFAVVTKKSTQDKFAFGHPLLQPKFAILDPRVTFSLPERQVTNGIVDAFVHTIEQYLTYDVGAKLQDRFAEGLLQTLVEEGPRALSEPDNYQVRANLMWTATMALNGLIGSGVPQDWSTHMIGHEITAQYDLDHAQTLAIVLPRLMWEQRENKRQKLLQYAQRVWNITEGNDEQRIRSAIDKTEQFFHSVGMKTRLSDYGLSEDSVDTLVAQLERHGLTALGEKQDIDLKKSRQILQASV